jgi:predicted membrane metal-binding protein
MTKGQALAVALVCTGAMLFMLCVLAKVWGCWLPLALPAAVCWGIWYYKWRRDVRLSTQVQTDVTSTFVTPQAAPPISSTGSTRLFIPAPLEDRQPR